MSDIYAAIFKAQGELDGVARNAKNPHFKSRYATLEAVIDTVKPALRKHGLGFMQMPGAVRDGVLEIRTMFFNEAGSKVDFITGIPLPKQDPQGVGSAITYGCRYALMAALGLPPVDDDGNAASVIEEPRKSSYALKKENPKRWNEIELMIRSAATTEHLRAVWKMTETERASWPQNWVDAFKEECSKRRDELMAVAE